MRFEIPEFKRCCFCVPLRYGLLGWAYLSLIHLALFTFIVSLQYRYAIYRRDYADITYITFTMILLLSNLASNFFLIVAAHKKNIKLLNIYKIYALGLAVANFLLLMSYVIYELACSSRYFSYYWYWMDLIALTLLYVIYIGIQFYIIALVRSEVLKLESNQKFEFSNLAAEAEKTYYEPETIKVEDQPILNTETK